MTARRQAMRDEAAKLERLMSDLKEIRLRRDADRGKALVALRRQLSDQVAQIAKVVRPILDHDVEAVDRAAFRHLHSTLLSRLALHQANWPAVLVAKAIGAADADYARSAQAVDEASLAVIAWVREWAVRH